MPRPGLARLGGFHAATDGTPISGFDADKTRPLLVHLAVEAAHPQRRAPLAGRLWPEPQDEPARRNPRYDLSKPRHALGMSAAEESEPGCLRVTPQTVGLDPAADLELDVAAFLHLIASRRAHRHRKLSACTTCHAR